MTNYTISDSTWIPGSVTVTGHFRFDPSGKLRLANFMLFIKEHYQANRNRLLGQTSNVVNCLDCASLLVTFTNILGGDLSVARIGNYDPNLGMLGYKLNPIVPMGSDHFETIQFQLEGGFRYHAVTVPTSIVTPPIDGNTVIYDACLKLGVPDPTKKLNGGLIQEGDCRFSAGLLFDISNNLKINKIVGNIAGDLNCNPVLGMEPDIFGINAKFEIIVNDPTTLCSIKKDNEIIVNFHDLTTARATDVININFVTGAVSVGKKFSFETTYDYNEYKASLSAPGNGGRKNCVWFDLMSSITIE
jgi:hypothetical protein